MKAIFPGSFNPFTIGHKDIVDRALRSIADRVVIAVGINSSKQNGADALERVAAIKAVYEGDERVEVISYDCLTADIAKKIGADCILRGVRSVKDFEYERDIAEVNRRLTGVETILLYTSPELAHISSSIVRELRNFGKDVSALLP